MRMIIREDDHDHRHVSASVAFVLSRLRHHRHHRCGPQVFCIFDPWKIDVNVACA